MLNIKWREYDCKVNCNEYQIRFLNRKLLTTSTFVYPNNTLVDIGSPVTEYKKTIKFIYSLLIAFFLNPAAAKSLFSISKLHNRIISLYQITLVYAFSIL